MIIMKDRGRKGKLFLKVERWDKLEGATAIQ
jgi:hypothetical protein